MILGQHAVAVQFKAKISDPTHTKVGMFGIDRTPHTPTAAPRPPQAPCPPYTPHQPPPPKKWGTGTLYVRRSRRGTGGQSGTHQPHARLNIARIRVSYQVKHRAVCPSQTTHTPLVSHMLVQVCHIMNMDSRLILAASTFATWHTMCPAPVLSPPSVGLADEPGLLDTLTRRLPFGCPGLFGQPERRRRCAVSLQVKHCLCHQCFGCLDIGCVGP